MNGEHATWLPLGKVSGRGLEEANAQLHHAIQFIAMAGKYLIPGKEDDSHTSMTWDRERHSFTGGRIKAPTPFRVAVHGLRMNLMILDDNMRVINELHLPGVTIGYGFAWLREQLAALGIEHGVLKKKLHYSIPEHSLDRCSSFRISNPEAFREMAKLRNNAEYLLNRTRKKFERSTPVRIWPHHFDSACLIQHDEKGRRTISPGLAISDDSVDEPYFFVNIWTEDGVKLPDGLPAPEHGRWQREGWQGAVLPYSVLSMPEVPSEQFAIADRFFQHTSETLYDLLG